MNKWIQTKKDCYINLLHIATVTINHVKTTDEEYWYFQFDPASGAPHYSSDEFNAKRMTKERMTKAIDCLDSFLRSKNTLFSLINKEK